MFTLGGYWGVVEMIRSEVTPIGGRRKCVCNSSGEVRRRMGNITHRDVLVCVEGGF